MEDDVFLRRLNVDGPALAFPEFNSLGSFCGWRAVCREDRFTAFDDDRGTEKERDLLHLNLSATFIIIDTQYYTKLTYRERCLLCGLLSEHTEHESSEQLLRDDPIGERHCNIVLQSESNKQAETYKWIEQKKLLFSA